MENEYLEKLLSQAGREVDSIQSVIDLIHPPFEPVCDDRGYLYDDTTIAVRCSTGHIHKYPIKKIRADYGISLCITCGKETRLGKTVRTTAEKILGVPFVKTYKHTVECNFEYANPALGILIACCTKPGEHTCTTVDNWLVITVHKPIDAPAMRAVIYKYLNEYPKLSAEQSRAVSAAGPKKSPLLSRIIYKSDPLPYSREFAKYVGTKNIVADDICLENCTDDYQK